MGRAHPSQAPSSPGGVLSGAHTAAAGSSQPLLWGIDPQSYRAGPFLSNCVWALPVSAETVTPSFQST